MPTQVSNTSGSEENLAQIPTQDTQDTQDTTQDTQESGSENTTQEQLDTPLPALTPEPDVSPEFDENRVKMIEDLKEQIAQGLKEDTNIILNTHYTLLGIAELLALSGDFFKFYSYQCSAMTINNKHFNELKAQIYSVSEFVNNALEHIARTHQNANTLYNNCEKMLDETQSEITHLQASLAEVQGTMRLLNDLKAQLVDIEDLRNALNAQVKNAQILKNQIQSLSQTLLNEMQVALLNDKEMYERELLQKKDEYIELFTQREQALEEKINDFNALWIIRDDKCNQTIQKIEQFLEQLVHYEHQIRVEFESNIKNLQNATQEHLVSLDTHNAALRTELEEFKQQKAQELDSHKDRKIEQLDKAFSIQSAQMRIVKDDFVRDINALNTMQIQEIKELFYQIANDKATLGSNYQSVSFSSNDVFTPISGILDYFVFVRGGDGDTLGGNNGGITSFGEYLSAQGGVGNSAGIGQRGESKSAFIHLNDDGHRINVAVSTGGLCVVSYASSEQVAIDTSFLSDEDCAALIEVFNLQERQSLLDSITSRAQEHKMKNILAIAKNIDIEDIEHTNAMLEGRIYSTSLALKCAMAKGFLETNTSINEYIARLEFVEQTQDTQSQEQTQDTQDTQDLSGNEENLAQDSTQDTQAQESGSENTTQDTQNPTQEWIF